MVLSQVWARLTEPSQASQNTEVDKTFCPGSGSPPALQILPWLFSSVYSSNFSILKERRHVLWKIMPLAVLEEDFSSPINRISPDMHSSSVNLFFSICHCTIPSIPIKPFLYHCFLHAPLLHKTTLFICPCTFLHIHGSFSFLFSEFQLNHIKWWIKTGGKFKKPLKWKTGWNCEWQLRTVFWSAVQF